MIAHEMICYLHIHSFTIINPSAFVAAFLAHLPSPRESHGDLLALALTGVLLMISSIAVRRATLLFRRLSQKHRQAPVLGQASETELGEPVGRSL